MVNTIVEEMLAREMQEGTFCHLITPSHISILSSATPSTEFDVFWKKNILWLGKISIFSHSKQFQGNIMLTHPHITHKILVAI